MENRRPSVLNKERLIKGFGFGQARAISLGGVELLGAGEYSVALHLLCSVDFVQAQHLCFTYTVLEYLGVRVSDRKKSGVAQPLFFRSLFASTCISHRVFGI